MIKTGRLNKRISFLNPISGTDSLGQDKLTYEEFRTVWATVVPYKSNDSSLYGKKTPEASHKFYIRYRSDITPDMRISYNGKLFKMVGYPVDLEEKHELFEIQAELVT